GRPGRRRLGVRRVELTGCETRERPELRRLRRIVDDAGIAGHLALRRQRARYVEILAGRRRTAVGAEPEALGRRPDDLRAASPAGLPMAAPGRPPPKRAGAPRTGSDRLHVGRIL